MGGCGYHEVVAVTLVCEVGAHEVEIWCVNIRVGRLYM